MLIYFTDRQLNILGQASTDLFKGYFISEDMLTEDVDSGVSTLTLRIKSNGEDTLKMQNMCKEGNYVLKQSGNAFKNRENSYNALFTIIETEFDTAEETMYMYCEDAGLDLLNRVIAPATYSTKTLYQMLTSFVPGDWTVQIWDGTSATKTYTAENENTCIERINSVANLFGYEVFYSFEIERFNITRKLINLVKKRGDQDTKIQLRYDRDLSDIVIKTSMANMCTCLAVTGGTPDNSQTPINLNGYTYSYTDPETGDKYQVVSGQMRNITAMSRWASKLDTDGYMVRQFSYDTTDKATLAGQARAQLQAWSKPEINYEVSVINLPENARVGDRVYIIDDAGELYLDARILKLETSVTSGTINATFGDYLIKESGIYEQIAQMANDFSSKIKDGLDGVTLSVISSGGNIFHNTQIASTLVATVFIGANAITSQSDLEDIFDEGAEIRWYEGSSLVGTGFSYTVLSNQASVNIKCQLYTE